MSLSSLAAEQRLAEAEFGSRSGSLSWPRTGAPSLKQIMQEEQEACQVPAREGGGRPDDARGSLLPPIGRILDASSLKPRYESFALLYVCRHPRASDIHPRARGFLTSCAS